MRSDISSQHPGPPNYLISGREDEPLLPREFMLVLRGDGKSPRTIEGYSDSIRQLASFLGAGGFPLIERATSEHIREWLSALREKGNRPATVNIRYRGVSAFYKWLVREGELTENALDRIQPPSVPETIQPHYKPEEIQAVLKALRSRRLRVVDAVRMRAIALVLFDAGLRASELCALRVADVNWDNQTAVVRQTKGGDQRVVSLGTAASRALHSYLRLRATSSPWLFTTLGEGRLTLNVAQT